MALLNGTEAVFNEIPYQSNQQVTIEKEWFLTFNMAMIIFSATFIIHLNCWYNSLTLLYKKPVKSWLPILNLIQTSCSVSCHLSRLSDYFFITDCTIKGYYNMYSYFVAIMSMDFMVAYFAFKTLAVVTKWNFNSRVVVGLGIFGVLPLCIKMFVLTLGQLNISNKVVAFNFCLAEFNNNVFSYVLLEEIYLHSCTFLYVATLAILLLKGFHGQKIEPDQSLPLDLKGLFAILFLDLTTLSLFLPVVLGNAGPNPEVLVQSKWALQSKCFNIAYCRFMNNFATLPKELDISFQALDQEKLTFTSLNRVDFSNETVYKIET